MPARKTYLYGKQSKANDTGKDEWKNVATATATESPKTSLPKKKGIWAKASSASPFNYSPLKKQKINLKINTKLDDPFGFDDSDTECFNFKEDGIKTSPKKGKYTPSKLASPRSPTDVNPRLFGKSLPSGTVTISADDLSPKKGRKKPTKSLSPSKVFKKGTLAALKAELSPSKEAQSQSPKKKTVLESEQAKNKGSKEKKKTPSPVKKAPQKVKESASPKKSAKTAKSENAKKKSPVKKETKDKTTTKETKKVTSNTKSPLKKPASKTKSPAKKTSPKKSPTKAVKKSSKSPKKKVISTKLKTIKPTPKGSGKKKASPTKAKAKLKSPAAKPKPSPKKQDKKLVASKSPTKKINSAAKKTSVASPNKDLKSRKRKAVSPVATKKQQKIAKPTVKSFSPAKKVRSPPKTVKSPPPVQKKAVDQKNLSLKRKNKTSPNSSTQESKRKRGPPRKRGNQDNSEDNDSSTNSKDEVNDSEKEVTQNTAEDENTQNKIFPKLGDSPQTEDEEDDDNTEIKDESNEKEEEEDEEEKTVEESMEIEESHETDGFDEKTDKNNEKEEEEESNKKDGKDTSPKKKPEPKAKSLFSYYDKQKKTSKTENIFKNTKKMTIRFDNDSDDEDKEIDNGMEVDSMTPRENISETKQTEKSNIRNLKVEEKCPTPTKDDGSKGEGEQKLKKSPFKSLKSRAFRRFSALPTDISMFTAPTDNAADQDQDDADDGGNTTFHTANIFGQSGSSSFRVRKDEKELFTVVRDTKHAYQCLEHGESQLFKDDLEYLLDGLKSTHNTSTRCLSALELASKCMSPEFRMHIKAHGLIEAIFVLLQDAHSDELLALCTSVIIFILSKDRLKTGFDKKIIAYVLKLSMKAPSEKADTKAAEKINNKVKAMFEKYNDPVLDVNNITASVLARETLLSLTAQRTGEWFKEELRTLGGLDHISDTIYASSKSIQKREDMEKHFCQTERCLLLLCDVTFKSAKNQEYLGSYREGLLIDSCVRILTSITSNIDLVNDLTNAIQSCMFSVLRFLTNMSHENEKCSVKICKQDDALKCFLRCVLYMPQFLADNKSFDFIVVALGLLINLTEHSKQNTAILNTAFGPACYESESSSSIDDQIAPVEALTQLFLVRNEACKEGDLMEELEKLEREQEEKEASLHYHEGEDALVCGDRFDDTVEESAEQTPDNGDSAPPAGSSSGSGEGPIDANGLNQKEKQDIRKTLEKAHQHMEDSHVAAYSALLIGLLAENNKDNQETIHSLLPDGDFKPMEESLEKILAFMRMTGATNESGFKVIERIIDVFKQCGQTYPKKIEVAPTPPLTPPADTADDTRQPKDNKKVTDTIQQPASGDTSQTLSSSSSSKSVSEMPTPSSVISPSGESSSAKSSTESPMETSLEGSPVVSKSLGESPVMTSSGESQAATSSGESPAMTSLGQSPIVVAEESPLVKSSAMQLSSSGTSSSSQGTTSSEVSLQSQTTSATEESANN